MKRWLMLAVLLALPASAQDFRVQETYTATEFPGLLGYIKNFDLNNAGNDVRLEIKTGSYAADYIIRKVVVTNASTSLALSPATIGIFTGPDGTGGTIVSATTLTTLTSQRKFVELTLVANMDTVSANPLYARNVVGNGAAASVDVLLFGDLIP